MARLGLTAGAKKRIGIMAVGYAAKAIEEFLFDWLLYGTVVLYCTSQWGKVEGSVAAFLMMTPLSAVICLFYLKLYDWFHQDWFGFEALKEITNSPHKGWMSRMVFWIARLGAFPAFIILSINTDPFIVTVYLRKGEDAYDGLSGRDWFIFWSSVIFSNSYWTLRWSVIVIVANYLLAHLPIWFPGIDWTGIENQCLDAITQAVLYVKHLV